jgi:CheY-like chemotaxis protein
MPQLDGWEATRRLKRDPRTAHIPVLACTGHAFGAPVERAIEVGCDAYVVKPCLPEDLLQHIRRLLARPRPDHRRA